MQINELIVFFAVTWRHSRLCFGWCRCCIILFGVIQFLFRTRIWTDTAFTLEWEGGCVVYNVSLGVFLLPRIPNITEEVGLNEFMPNVEKHRNNEAWNAHHSTAVSWSSTKNDLEWSHFDHVVYSRFYSVIKLIYTGNIGVAKFSSKEGTIFFWA